MKVNVRFQREGSVVRCAVEKTSEEALRTRTTKLQHRAEQEAAMSDVKICDRSPVRSSLIELSIMCWACTKMNDLYLRVLTIIHNSSAVFRLSTA